jgi:hypothetical protein
VTYIYDDGGRATAGFKGQTGDCVTRAIAIATRLPYQEVYDLVNRAGKQERLPRGKMLGGRTVTIGSRSSARTGVKKPTTRLLLKALGWTWVPTMSIGSGCKVHLLANELPAGRIICKLSRHIVAVVDGVVRDTYDPSRGGTRCVYGYWYDRRAI